MSNRSFFDRFKEYIGTIQFDAMRIGLASAEKILSLSYGEVKKIETINYRTLKPERDGLFCAKIFGPQKDWECNCGKYRRMKHRGVTCEKCGVEVIQSRVRRERMGHIKLVSPVCHIWFLKGLPSYLSIILELSVKDLEKVAYFDAYIVLAKGNSPFDDRSVITVQEYEEYLSENPEDIEFRAESGAEGIEKILKAFDLIFELRKVHQEIENSTSMSSKHKLSKKYKVLKGMNEAGIRPEWMIITILPVIPPDLRPLVPLPGGRFASSDLNDLYRRVLNRNIRLRRLIDLEAPNVIIRNEKRMLQESVDALIDNGKRGQFVKGTNKRPLKSLSEMLRGKQGRFRQNLLGKRVDYSARSVIVVEPELKLDQCGLPKIMALELFKPYVYIELQRREVVASLRAAKRLVSSQTPEVWEALEHVVKGRPVMLNRAPTLHRLGFQGFYPILVEGKAIRLHPLVCKAYNADFDGDQMAVHLPLSRRAQAEVVALMFSSNNLISPADGRPLFAPTQEMVLGLYFLTKKKMNVSGQDTVFSSVQELTFAYQHGKLHVQAPIKLRVPGYDQLVSTTVGRVLLYDALPRGSEIDWVNKVMKSKDFSTVIYKVHRKFGPAATAISLDKIKDLGFHHATKAGISLSLDDVVIPDNKHALVEMGRQEVKRIEKLYLAGAITNGERYNKIVQVWARITEDVASSMLSNLEKIDEQATLNTGKEEAFFNPIFIMLDSGAKGSKQQIRQLGGMRGLMINPAGRIIDNPVLSNLKEGLSVFEYFTSTHGARKGLADTALKTADAGYLTRRLVDVAQDVVIAQMDCGGAGFIEICDLESGNKVMEKLEERAFSRVTAVDVIDPISGKLIIREDTLIGDDEALLLRDSSVTHMKVRSPLTCGMKRGICAKCYGLDLSKSAMVDIGLAVGVIAAQSIGEPGTQLTLKTFHTGGAASGLVEENFRVSRHAGIVHLVDLTLVKNPETGVDFVVNRRGKLLIMSADGREIADYPVEYGSAILVAEGEKIEINTKLFEWTPYKVIMSHVGGQVEYVDLIENVTYVEHYNEQGSGADKLVVEAKDSKYHPCIAVVDNAGHEIARYYVPAGANLLVAHGDMISPAHVIVSIPREKQKSKDITGGLPRVVELFEARNPKDPAILSDNEGVIEVGAVVKNMRKVTLISDYGEVFEYLVPKGKHLNVEHGERIPVGFAISNGDVNVHDVLRIMGVDAVQAYLVKGIQEVYMSQGVRIHDKHIEVIVRQMLRKVRVIDPGDTNFVIGEAVDRVYMKSVNDSMMESTRKIAITKPILMGITKSSLGTDSFIASASFQETTRVLAEAAVTGQVDYLRCLKSNVAIGRLIAAGTGVAEFRKKYIGSDESEFEKEACREEEMEIGLDDISLG